MKISKQARRDAKQLFNVCKVAGVLDENRVRQSVTAVIAKKRAALDAKLASAGKPPVK